MKKETTKIIKGNKLIIPNENNILEPTAGQTIQNKTAEHELRKTIEQTRRYANHWEWPDKQRKELGIVEDWLESMRLANESIYSSPRIGPSSNQAPDCIVLDKNKNYVAVELCELVCEEAVAENQRGHVVYRDWQPAEILIKIKEILEKKDKKNYHGGPYSAIIVLIHTDEPVISYNCYKELIVSGKFNGLKQVNEAFLLFSYEPGIERYPYIKLTLSGFRVQP